ncbi:LLM class F420-dependent oxidoreductase [Kribbia dieselivorans]|uniref:LLM class F420-dependent oxidoreductase n=1 Tax=Kribbia dieselivorans TaxID=331526 RepID=UPI00083844C5|nr:LLM class F420-dependent oxidoreductase [Kribbia dieselivorans]
MDLRVFVEPQQGATYADQLAVAQRAEECGYGAFFRSDHLLAMGREGLPGPTETWTTLGAIARETTTIRLGTLMTSVTFRLPGLLAATVAQVDEMSGGRVEFGFGAGWFEAEHAAYGIPFADNAGRFDQLEEALAIITGLWNTPVGEKFNHPGPLWPITDSPALPKPTQPHIPILIGGQGRRRTPQLTARYADEFNLPFVSRETATRQFGRVRDALSEAGRNPADLVWSSALVICVGKDDTEIRRRAEAIGRDVDELRTNGLCGTPAEVVDTLGKWAEIGSQRTYLQMLDMADLDHLDLIASEVMPQV